MAVLRVRTCLRGWGCELQSVTALVLGVGSSVWCALLLLFGGCIYWWGAKGGRLRHFVHWVFVLLFPLWLAWYIWCFVDVARHKTTGFWYGTPLASASASASASAASAVAVVLIVRTGTVVVQGAELLRSV